MDIEGKLTAFHHTAITLFVNGKSVEEVAIDLDVAPGILAKLRTHPLWAAEEKRLKQEKELRYLNKTVKEVLPAALETLKICITQAVTINQAGRCIDYKTRLAAAKFAIDYAHENLTSDEAEQAIKLEVPEWMKKHVAKQME